jgi:DNA-binding cell septation regulator SpoVG
MKKKEVNEAVNVNAKVTRANQVNDTVFFDLELNGVSIYGLKVVEGSKGDFISWPSHKGKDGKYYNYAWCKLSDEQQKDIIHQVEEML